MSHDDERVRQKEISMRKRVATEWAAQIHDLVEDRLLTDYARLPELAQKTVEACDAWKLASEAPAKAGK